MDQLDENKDEIIELSRSKRRKEKSKLNKRKKTEKPSKKQKNQQNEEGLSHAQEEYNNVNESDSKSDVIEISGDGESLKTEVFEENDKKCDPNDPATENNSSEGEKEKLQVLSRNDDTKKDKKKNSSFFSPPQVHDPQKSELDSSDITGAKKIKVKKKASSFILIITVFAIIVIAVGFSLFGVDRVEGNSMSDSLKDGDFVFYIKLNTSLKTGDIVLIRNQEVPSGVIVKRVIAVGEDVISVQQNGTVLLNKEFLEEPYAKYENLNTDEPLQYYPYYIPEGTVFVMGDNRGNSKDSRFLSVGPVPVSDVIGKALTLFRSY